MDITPIFEQFRQEYQWNVIAPGPGHGIQLDNGRLLVPVWLSSGGHAHRPSCMATIYSDDHGKTWQRGEIVGRNNSAGLNPNETVAVQLSDGRVMLNIRNESKRRRRLVAFSPDGATHWTEPAFDEALFEPICMASMIRVQRPGDRIPLHSVCQSRQPQRALLDGLGRAAERVWRSKPAQTTAARGRSPASWKSEAAGIPTWRWRRTGASSACTSAGLA